jgi:predicted Zn finger-like uncharacterized protein
MPVEIHCSSCAAKLRIPDHLVGKKVRCTKCKAEFLAALPAVQPTEPALEIIGLEPETPATAPPASLQSFEFNMENIGLEPEAPPIAPSPSPAVQSTELPMEIVGLEPETPPAAPALQSFELTMESIGLKPEAAPTAPPAAQSTEVPMEIVEVEPETPRAAPRPDEEEPLEIVKFKAEAPPAAVPRKRRRETDGVSEEGRRPRLEEDDEPVDRKPRRPRRRRTDPNSAVKGPALGLMIVGYAGALLNFLLIIGNAVLVVSTASTVPAAAQPRGSMPPAAQAAVSAIMGLLFTAAWTGFVIRGANSMASRDSYGMAMGACIVAMLPCCSLGCLGGIPIGIWGIIVLCNDDVKQSFR